MISIWWFLQLIYWAQKMIAIHICQRFRPKLLYSEPSSYIHDNWKIGRWEIWIEILEIWLVYHLSLWSIHYRKKLLIADLQTVAWGSFHGLFLPTREATYFTRCGGDGLQCLLHQWKMLSAIELWFFHVILPQYKVLAFGLLGLFFFFLLVPRVVGTGCMNHDALNLFLLWL